MSLPAWAIARPENRVRDFFPASSKSTSADLDQTAGARRENPGYDYDFASGMHKYLYCHDNPVTGLDPSGHDDIGSMMMAMDISASLDALPGITTLQGALSSGSKGGPDVTVSLNRTLDNIDQTFTAWPDSVARASCERMVDYFGGGYVGDWDMMEPFEIGTDHQDKYGWGRTVTFYGYTYYGGAANYAMWGEMFSLAHKRFGFIRGLEWNLTTALKLAKGYKKRYGWGLEEEEALWFTRYGYNRTMPQPGNVPGRAPNRTPISQYEGSFSTQHEWKWLPNDVFDWKWLPGKNY